ncbi:MAG: DUF547 domain-containing protein [Maricaulaceae bacterium]
MSATIETQMPLDSVAARWDAVLGQYVKTPDDDDIGGRNMFTDYHVGVALFDYAGLLANDEDRAALTDYIAHLATQTPSDMEDADAIAYWANLYNALTVDVVLQNYPVSSIREIGGGLFSKGPWGRKIITVESEHLSLDNIEHDIMRKQFPSPLIHYMVNCASIGCPNLKAGLWRAETLDADRELAAKAFINSPRGVGLQKRGLKLSSIYKWFKEDFGGSKKNVLAHIEEYAEGDLAAAIENGMMIGDYYYDWALNDIIAENEVEVE